VLTRLRCWRRIPPQEGGYTLVEFAMASVVFLLITFGTIDLGRAIYLYSELHTAVRDAAREAKVSNANGYGYSNGTISHRVHVAKNLINGVERNRTGLSSATSSVSCTGGCQPGDLMTVEADLPFSAVLPGFLGVGPLALHASATVKVE
jgi:Flp pilus assembly protein TadG